AVIAAAGHTTGLVAGAHAFCFAWSGIGAGGIAAGAAADRSWFLFITRHGPEWAAGCGYSGTGHRAVTLYLYGVGGGVTAVFAALCGATHPERHRGHGRAPTGSRCHTGRRATGPLFYRGAAAS